MKQELTRLFWTDHEIPGFIWDIFISFKSWSANKKTSTVSQIFLHPPHSNIVRLTKRSHVGCVGFGMTMDFTICFLKIHDLGLHGSRCGQQTESCLRNVSSWLGTFFSKETGTNRFRRHCTATPTPQHVAVHG